MITIFSSGFTQKYRVNVLNTICLPENAINEYRYNYEGENINIDPSLASGKAIKKGAEVLIVIVDRHSEGSYKYIPLRKGSVIKFSKDAGFIFLKVKLLQFVKANDLSGFNKIIFEALKNKNIPQLQDSINDKNDGYYIIESESYLSSSMFASGSNVWHKIVETISELKIFMREDEIPIFTKFNLKLSKNGVLNLTKDKICDFVITYKKINHDVLSPIIKTQKSENLISISNDSFSANTSTDKISQKIKSKRYPEELDGYLSIKCDDEKILLPDCGLIVRVKEGKCFWVQVILALALFSFAEIFSTINFQSLNFQDIIVTHWEKILFTILQTIGLFWLFRLIGKRSI